MPTSVRLEQIQQANAELRAENKCLSRRIQQLERQLATLTQQVRLASRHTSNSTGKQAEDFVCHLLGAKPTERNADHDLVIGRRKFEVKGAKCAACRVGDYFYNRWTWHNFLGIGKKKTFHRLILVGEADKQNQDTYRDPGSPYVIFDISMAFAQQIAESRANYGGRFTFQLFTKRGGAKSSKLCQEIWKYEITRVELQQRYLK